MTDISETKYDEAILKNIDLEWAREMYKLWYWGGTNAKAPMSKQEVMSVLYKLMKDLK
jgi:hypothetical protein